ncbi:MAG: DNA polymerase III subunit gamma/tau [Verrucomicrobiota bacterium]|nr:DNA polymerase III subunit gamma/tau [Verrucomicrobiota bacterium]
MGYQVLARKFRPQRFDELVGQEHIASTLKNAIVSGKVGHAYLFVGSRGIGKTTTARIFAKSLNCKNPEKGEPCNKCDSCLEITSGHSLDVIEIDGASHNGVDDIRDLREQVQYSPANGKYKVYIIDEVHMLTKQAWNALLKTLEEPPPHVKFVFATTEPEKVLPTIISRCQRFDFKRIPVQKIVARLREIAEKEKVFVEDAALASIARSANGGMRDAQSIFDQMIAFCGGLVEKETITEKNVIEVFGIATSTELMRIVDAMLCDNPSEIIQTINNLADKGRDLERLYSDLLLYLRNVLVMKLSGTAKSLIDMHNEEVHFVQEMAKKHSAPSLQQLLQELIVKEAQLKYAANKRISLEVTLVSSARNANLVNIDDLLQQLNQIKRKPENSVSSENESKKKNLNPELMANEQVVAPPQPQKTDLNTPKPPEIPILPESQTTDGTPTIECVESEPEIPILPESQTTEKKQIIPKPVEKTERPNPPEEKTPPPANPQKKTSPEKEAPSLPASSEIHQSIDPKELDLNNIWHQLIKEVGKIPEKQKEKAIMQEMIPISIIDNILYVSSDLDFPEEHYQVISKKANLGLMQKALRRISDSYSWEIVIKRSIAKTENHKRKLKATPEVKEKIMQNPFVQKACDIFNGEVIDVRG